MTDYKRLAATMSVESAQPPETKPYLYLGSETGAVFSRINGLDRNSMHIQMECMYQLSSFNYCFWCNRGNSYTEDSQTAFNVGGNVRVDIGTSLLYMDGFGDYAEKWVVVDVKRNGSQWEVRINGNLVGTAPNYTFNNNHTLFSLFASHNNSIVGPNYALGGVLKIASFRLIDSDSGDDFAYWMPVPKGSTKYSNTAAPYNTFYDNVTGSYIQAQGAVLFGGELIEDKTLVAYNNTKITYNNTILTY